MNDTPKYLSAIVSDIAGAFKIPGGSVLGQAVQDLFEKRLKQARDILIEEISKGEKDIYQAAEVDEVAAIVYRYMRAAQEGTARINLRLLARIIAGQKTSGPLKADEFLYYADIIASLRHEEIMLLGTLYRNLQEELNEENPQTPEHKAQERAMKELIDAHVFISKEDFEATLGALIRTGLIINMGTWATTYKPSPFMNKLCKLSSFENLMRETGPATT